MTETVATDLQRWNGQFSQNASNGTLDTRKVLFEYYKFTIETGWKADLTKGGTALMKAVENGHEDIVKWLIETPKADVNVQTKNKFTALMIAAKQGHGNISRILLKHGARIDHRDHKGMTALSWASYNGKDEVVRILLEHGADLRLQDDIGFTALDWAIHENKPACYHLLCGRADPGFGFRAQNTTELWNKLSFRERRLYTRYWEDVVQQWVIKLNFKESIDFFRRSYLPETVLLDVWTLCSGGKDYLDIYTFMLGLRYIALAQKSRELKEELVMNVRKPLVPRFVKELPQCSEKRRQLLTLLETSNTGRSDGK